MSRTGRDPVNGCLGLFWLCIAGLLLGPSRPACAQMTTGTYVGDGAPGRAITGLGFRPDAVIIKGYDSGVPLTLTSTVLRTSTMTGDNTKPLVLDNARHREPGPVAHARRLHDRQRSAGQPERNHVLLGGVQGERRPQGGDLRG